MFTYANLISKHCLTYKIFKRFCQLKVLKLYKSLNPLPERMSGARPQRDRMGEVKVQGDARALDMITKKHTLEDKQVEGIPRNTITQ
jgi:hypothetical protein